MDKILVTVFLSALAGFITAVLSIVKLVNEKESKTTDYRQAWTTSVRESFASLVGKINAQASQIANEIDTRSTLVSLIPVESIADPALRQRGLDFNEDCLKALQESIRETRREIHEAYYYTCLHFKPNDLSFNRIEQKFDVAMGLLTQLSKSDKKDERAELRERIHGVASEIAGYARDILKTEWETVKKGEPAYKLTKRWSIAGSVVMLFVLLSIGVHTGISIWKNNIAIDTVVKAEAKNQTATNPLPNGAALQNPEQPVAPAKPANRAKK